MRVGDSRNCFTWSQPGEPGERVLTHRSGGSPVISTVVRAITTTDRMHVYGLEPQRARQELYYHDAYYEGIEQEFRGFGVTDSWAIGDWNNPTTITRTWFHQGRRAQNIAADRLAYNPDESLKGREYLTETLDEAGNYLASAHATLAVRTLATGLDGRPIDYAYVSEANELRYDTTPFEASTATVELADVVRQAVSATTGALTSESTARTRHVPVRGLRAAHIRTTYDSVDNLGHVLQQTAHGHLGSPTQAADQPIVSHTEVTRVGTWTWRTARTWVDGPGGTQLGHTEVAAFTSAGDPRLTRTHVTGIPSLEFGPDIDGEAQGIGHPALPSTRTEIASVAYDAWGQPVAQCAGGDLGSGASFTTPPLDCLRFGTVTRDAPFGQLAETETAWVGRTAGATLTTSGTWNRGLALLLSATAPNGETSAMHYDGFGRPVAAVPPPVEGCAEGLPTTLIRYELTPSPTAQPLSRVLTTTIIRTASCGADHPIEGIAYVDGLGRPRAALATGDDGHAWVRSGITTFDQKGTVRRTYQPDFFDGDPNTFASVVALPSDIPYAVTRYDAFGRARGVIAEDGATVWTSHHALSTDVCDPLDNDHASPHYRTCTTARVDGHGRVIDQILRNRHPDSGAEEHYRLWSWYRQDGAVLALARTQQNAAVVRPAAPPTPGPTTVVRTFAYDSVGRRWTSADPDTDSRDGARTSANRSWRYLFNRVGDLAAVRDPRGCGQNFCYDLGGRLVGEQYVGCAEAASSADERPVADLPAGMLSLSETTGTIQVDVRYHYDSYADLDWSDTERPLDDDHLALGMPTGVEDRGQRSALSYDRRGNAVWSARQMALISAPPPLAPAASPNDAPRRTETVATGFVAYDEEHTYVRTATFDHAARPLSMTLPSDPDWDAMDIEEAPAVGGSLTYNRRGLPQTATATIGGDPYPIVAGIRYDRDGAVLRTTWGDARSGHAATVSETRYDRRRRPIRFLTTRDPTGSAPQTLAAVSTVVDQELVWDAASNLTDIVDHRDGSEWFPGFRPRTTHVDHDSLYRVVGAYFEYTQEDNRVFPSDTASNYRDTIDTIRQAGADPMETRPAEMLPVAPPSRAEALEWSYDFLGNSTEWSDDADSFYERSIGAIANGVELGTDLRPSALYFATNIREPLTTTEGNAGWLELEYGEGGNVTSMTVRAQCGPRAGQNVCTPGSSTDELARRDSLRATCECDNEQQYEYRWDELNRLAEARRWDRESGNWTLKVRQRYRYDGANQRTVKQTLSEDGQGGSLERIALYVLPGDFERRGLVRGATEYQPSGTGTETQYLVAGARLVWKHDSLDENAHQNRRLTVPLTDIIQTTAATLDLISGDLLEASTYYPNGARETLWADTTDPSAAEPMGFTGKEADEEVGLVYFGERYLIARVGRWASPDPLHVHAAEGGEALNSFHYVRGNVLQARDPVGLSIYTGVHNDRTVVSKGERGNLTDAVVEADTDPRRLVQQRREIAEDIRDHLRLSVLLEARSRAAALAAAGDDRAATQALADGMAEADAISLNYSTGEIEVVDLGWGLDRGGNLYRRYLAASQDSRTYVIGFGEVNGGVGHTATDRYGPGVSRRDDGTYEVPPDAQINVVIDYAQLRDGRDVRTARGYADLYGGGPWGLMVAVTEVIAHELGIHAGRMALGLEFGHAPGGYHGFGDTGAPDNSADEEAHYIAGAMGIAADSNLQQHLRDGRQSSPVPTLAGGALYRFEQPAQP